MAWLYIVNFFLIGGSGRLSLRWQPMSAPFRLSIAPIRPENFRLQGQPTEASCRLYLLRYIARTTVPMRLLCCPIKELYVCAGLSNLSQGTVHTWRSTASVIAQRHTSPCATLSPLHPASRSSISWMASRADAQYASFGCYIPLPPLLLIISPSPAPHSYYLRLPDRSSLYLQYHSSIPIVADYICLYPRRCWSTWASNHHQQLSLPSTYKPTYYEPSYCIMANIPNAC